MPELCINNVYFIWVYSLRKTCDWDGNIFFFTYQRSQTMNIMSETFVCQQHKLIKFLLKQSDVTFLIHWSDIPHLTPDTNSTLTFIFDLHKVVCRFNVGFWCKKQAGFDAMDSLAKTGKFFPSFYLDRTIRSNF